MKKILSLIFYLLFLYSTYASAQTLYESSKGTTSIVLRNARIVTINFADANVKFGYNRRYSDKKWEMGFEIKHKATEGFVALFKDSKFSMPETSAKFFVGRSFEPDNNSCFLNTIVGVDLEYKRGLYKLANIDTLGEISTSDKTYNGIFGKMFLNSFIDLNPPVEILFGIAIGYGRRNNFEQLIKVEVCETIATDSRGNLIHKCKNARNGEYKESNEITIDLNILCYLTKWTKNKIAIAILGHYDGIKDKNRFTPGLGVFSSKEGEPMKLLGGVTVEWLDGKLRIGLQVGFPF